MKIALVLAAPWVPGSVDMTEYLRQLERLGHEPVLICLDRAAGKTEYPVIAADRETLKSPGFYERLKLDAAIAFTWFNEPWMVAAMKKAGMTVLTRGDSDGLLSIRQFPAHHYRVRMSAAKTMGGTFTAAKHLLQRYLLQYKREDTDRLNSLAWSDLSVLETAQAAEHVASFLTRYDRADLISRLKVVPHFVADEFLTCDVKTTRSDCAVAIGRWEDPQKNAPLLAAAIEIHLNYRPATRFYIIGGEAGRSQFDELTGKYPQVVYTGPQNAAGVRRYLADARVLLSASRWEGSPVVGNEALAMGATIVGTPIPAFIDICRRGDFGKYASRHYAEALAAALAQEWSDWDLGRRDPVAISQYWRPLLSSKVVVSKLVQLLKGEESSPALAPRLQEAGIA